MKNGKHENIRTKKSNKLSRNQYRSLMKKRRKRTISITIILLLIIIYSTYKIFFNETNSSFIEKYGNRTVSNKILLKSIDDVEEKLKINKVNYNWGEDIEKGNNPQKLIIHHAASSGADAQTINKWHIDRGFGGIGYHYYIRKDGSIYKGREDDIVGAHAVNENRKSIGICLEGNYENEQLNEAQENALITLSTNLVIKYNLEDIVGHRDCNQTLCPGKNIDLSSIRDKVVNRLNSIIDKK